MIEKIRYSDVKLEKRNKWYFSPKYLLSYNVITYIMSELFEAKLRKIGNSLGIIVPSHVIEGLNYHKGDVVNVVIPSSKNIKRNKILADLAGIDKDKAPFKREKEDRY